MHLGTLIASVAPAVIAAPKTGKQELLIERVAPRREPTSP